MTLAPHKLQVRHLLILDGQPRRAFIMDDAVYSIGRDDKNAIVVNDASISRQHALLLRLPELKDNEYRYRLVDGSIGGKASANGTFVNGKPCTSEALNDGDLITFGKGIKAKYLMTSEEVRESDPGFLKAIQFHSIGASSSNKKETIIGEYFDPSELEQDHSEVTRDKTRSGDSFFKERASLSPSQKTKLGDRDQSKSTKTSKGLIQKIGQFFRAFFKKESRD